MAAHQRGTHLAPGNRHAQHSTLVSSPLAGVGTLVAQQRAAAAADKSHPIGAAGSGIPPKEIPRQ